MAKRKGQKDKQLSTKQFNEKLKLGTDNRSQSTNMWV